MQTELQGQEDIRLPSLRRQPGDGGSGRDCRGIHHWDYLVPPRKREGLKGGLQNVKALSLRQDLTDKSGMDRESFLETLKTQYAEEIHEAYLECEHEGGSTLDLKRLNIEIKKIRG